MFELIEALLQRWLMILARALMILGPLLLVFWVWRPRWVERFRIPQPREVLPMTREELPRTVLGLSVYLIPVALLIVAQKLLGYSMMYTDIAERGWGYFFLSMMLFAFIIDSWFYWAHRLMHAVPVLKRAHAVHHRSYNVTPVSAYSFDLVEALINMFPYLLMLFIVPWHPLALFAFSMLGMAYNGYIHLGYDFGYERRRRHPLLKWLYSSSHHSLHHQRLAGNYAVYFTFWDKLMGTEVDFADDPRGSAKSLRT